MAGAKTDFTTDEQALLNAFYALNRVDMASAADKIQALRRRLAPQGMTIASGNGAEGLDFELRALEYLYLLRNGPDE